MGELKSCGDWLYSAVRKRLSFFFGSIFPLTPGKLTYYFVVVVFFLLQKISFIQSALAALLFLVPSCKKTTAIIHYHQPIIARKRKKKKTPLASCTATKSFLPSATPACTAPASLAPPPFRLHLLPTTKRAQSKQEKKLPGTVVLHQLLPVSLTLAGGQNPLPTPTSRCASLSRVWRKQCLPSSAKNPTCSVPAL